MPNGVHIQPEICTDALYWPDATYVYVTYSIEGLTYYPHIYPKHGLCLTWSEPMEVTGYVGMSSGWQNPTGHCLRPSGLYITFEKNGWNGSSWTNQIWVTKSTDWGRLGIHRFKLPHLQWIATIPNSRGE